MEEWKNFNINTYARVHGGQEQIKIPTLLDFSVNVNPLGPPAGVIYAMTEAIGNIGCYPDPECQKLCCALADYHGIQSSQLICANGAADLIFQVINVLKPKKALCLAPDFSEYEQALNVQKTEIEYYELKKNKGYALDEEYLLDLKEVRPDLIVLVNPHNPTGTLIEEELLEKILLFTREEDITVLMDECFIEFTDCMSMIRDIRKFPNLFLIRAFTKSFALPGLRLGYGACANEKLLRQIKASRQPWSVSLIAQEAGLAALLESDYLKRTKELVHTERDHMMQELKHLGILTFPTAANYILFQSRENLKEQLMKRGICIRDCSNYRTLEAGFYRVAIRSHKENKQLIEALKDILA